LSLVWLDDNSGCFRLSEDSMRVLDFRPQVENKEEISIFYIKLMHVAKFMWSLKKIFCLWASVSWSLNWGLLVVEIK
jgi:hypothetical protein